MKYPTVEQVGKASHEQLARWFRFLPGCTTEGELEMANRIWVRLQGMGGFTPEISKKIGWGQP